MGWKACPVRRGWKHWGLSNLEERRPRCDLIALYNFLRQSGEGGTGFFFLVTNDKIHVYWNGIRLRQERFILDIKKNFCTVRVVKHWMCGDQTLFSKQSQFKCLTKAFLHSEHLQGFQGSSFHCLSGKLIPVFGHPQKHEEKKKKAEKAFKIQ